MQIDQEEIERLQAIEKKAQERYKRQNDYNKMIYDRVSVAFPKGTKEMIREVAIKKGMSVNSYISSVVLADVYSNFQDD